MTDIIYILNTKTLKDSGYEGSLNDLADNIADQGGVVSGSFEETGEPVMTVYGIEEEDLLTLLEEGGIENAAEIISTSRVEDNDDTDYDQIESEFEDQDEDQNDDSVDDDLHEIEDGDDDEDNDLHDIEDEDEDDDIIEIDDDVVDEIEDLHSEEEDLHDREEEIHDQEEEIDPNDDEENLHDQEEEIHDQEEDLHDDIEEDLEDRLDDIDENKKIRKGTQNLSESVTRDIINRVKDAYILDRIQKRAEVIDNINESVKNLTINMNPWTNSIVNGQPIWKYNNIDIVDMIKESKSSYKDLYKKYKSLNESHSRRKDIVKALKKHKLLIEILESEAKFRNINRKNTKLNEDLDQQNNENNNQEGDQEATLTSIVFKVKNADEFIKVLTDNGIPGEALKKGTTDNNNDTQDNNQTQEDNTQQQPGNMAPDAGLGGAPAPAPAAPAVGGTNPFESVTTRLTKSNKLNEAGNPFDELAGDGNEPASTGDSDQPGAFDGVDPLNADEAQSASDGEEVILTDTSYAAKVQKILEDIYGYPKDQFNDKIGGEIIDEDGSDDDNDPNNIFNDEDGSDGSDGSEDDESSVGKEESIRPEDIFSDLPGGL